MPSIRTILLEGLQTLSQLSTQISHQSQTTITNNNNLITLYLGSQINRIIGLLYQEICLNNDAVSYLLKAQRYLALIINTHP